MPQAVLHWVITPLILVVIVGLRLWGNRVINRRRQGEEAGQGKGEDGRRRKA